MRKCERIHTLTFSKYKVGCNSLTTVQPNIFNKNWNK